MEEAIILDNFEKNLQQNKEKLENCQRTKNLTSCYNCPEIFTCQTRKNYVDAVYNSMSKGKNEGGFDF
ncbi:hypothetical protein [Campylobacter novaezeelandiae]|uniref:hypothetical protein n=1 Tax=Campylobacter novaezeelandiae TaxID=2267891 RepID=UPI0019089687|nr:hypothetical protein [Campylobacter novaezeelandiae]MBK1964089.1 hypothetical protein [Campylobacter novaezeelandiae]MBK1993456.1 hypothetical protein [Campylobacter novaezeelandiae]